MNLQLKGKSAWVTGSSRGIGLACARALLQEGARVLLCNRTPEALEKTRAGLAKEFGEENVASVSGDVTQADACQQAVQTAARAFGGLDVLVANVGTGRIGGKAAPSQEDWDLAITQNLRAATQAARHALPALEKTSGSVVVVGSIAGLEDLGAPLAYASVKAALHAWVKGAGRDAAKRGVRINAVVPGNIYFKGGTWDRKKRENPEGVEQYLKQEVPMARFGAPEEIADAVAFLASARASFITGAALVADGGQTKAF